MRKLVLHGMAAAALVACAWPAMAVDFNAVNLVTDNPLAHPGQITDAGLQNAWGMSYGATTPFWVSSNGTGTSTLYRVNPLTQATSKVALTVTIPGAGNPTGQVFNADNASGNFNGDLFLFVSEDGTISGWRGALGTAAETLVPASSTSRYKGAAFASMNGNGYLYAANFFTGAIDVVKGKTTAPSLTGTFTDPNLPAGYAPFNVQNLNGTLYVTYAVQDAQKADEVAGAGLGIVDRYDLNGNLLGRVASGGTLNAPWGLAIAPSSFGTMAGALLVGDFGDGRINAFDASTNSFLGQVTGSGGNPLTIDGLWAIAPGNNGSAGSHDFLYFTAGPDQESHGVFGVLTPVPEPSTWASLSLGLALLVGVTRRMRKS